MKRKAMLMGVAVMTGMPGVGLAKEGKTVHAGQKHSATALADVESNLVMESAARVDGDALGGRVSMKRAWERFSGLQSLLGWTNFAVSAKPTASLSGWRVELLQNPAGAWAQEDPRLQRDRPWGLALRLGF
ncbi:MAG TPA: hypothetical protein PKH69_05700 [Thiobacillaceae bacterium]|nr:hypothetical protein [Thiobacillaceae bacterium]HNU64202.1 hypothetical protein [Thiobacillaceae bacterium]